MAFVVGKRTPTYTWPIKYSVPADGGRYDTINFRMIFNRLTQVRRDELQARANLLLEKARNGDTVDWNAENDALLREVCAGWEEVEDDAKQPIAFSTKALFEQVDQFDGLRDTLVRHFWDSLNGAREKN